jgi:hypothetical protein
LLFLKNHDETIYLVPSLCREAALPKDFTKNGKNLRQLREHIVSTPHLRVERILNLISKFSQGEKGKRDVSNIKDYGLELNQELCCFKGNKLADVKLIDPSNKLKPWQEYSSHRFPHAEPL